MEYKKTIKSVIGWMLYLMLLAALVYGVPKGLSVALKTPYPMAAVTSGSMWPTLKKGDMVLIQGIKSKEEINVGDIIIYKNPVGFTIHRVIKKDNDMVITKGDANNVSDIPINYEAIIGKTVELGSGVFKIPYLGKISMLLRKQNHDNANKQ